MRGGFCRPPRQLYPQEERGIQRPDNSTFTRLSPSQKWQIRSIFCTSDLCLSLLPNAAKSLAGKDLMVHQLVLFETVQTGCLLKSRLSEPNKQGG